MERLAFQRLLLGVGDVTTPMNEDAGVSQRHREVARQGAGQLNTTPTGELTSLTLPPTPLGTAFDAAAEPGWGYAMLLL